MIECLHFYHWLWTNIWWHTAHIWLIFYYLFIYLIIKQIPLSLTMFKCWKINRLGLFACVFFCFWKKRLQGFWMRGAEAGVGVRSVTLREAAGGMQSPAEVWRLLYVYDWASNGAASWFIHATTVWNAAGISFLRVLSLLTNLNSRKFFYSAFYCVAFCRYDQYRF